MQRASYTELYARIYFYVLGMRFWTYGLLQFIVSFHIIIIKNMELNFERQASDVHVLLTYFKCIQLILTPNEQWWPSSMDVCNSTDATNLQSYWKQR